MTRSTFHMLFYANGSKKKKQNYLHHGTGCNKRDSGEFNCKLSISKTS